MPKRRSGEKAQETGTGTGKAAVLPARASGGAAGGPSLVPQSHGGALLSGGKPGNAGGRRSAERRARRMERSEEIKDALTGHIESLAKIMGRLLKEADGEQYRCASCGAFGPKVSKMGLKDAAAVVQTLMAAVKEPADMATIVPIQINVHAGGPLVAGVVPDNGPRNPTAGQNP